MKDRTAPARWIDELPDGDALREALVAAREETPDDARLERVYGGVLAAGDLDDGGDDGDGGAGDDAGDDAGDGGTDGGAGEAGGAELAGDTLPRPGEHPDVPPPLVVPPGSAVAPGVGATGAAVAFGSTTLGKLVGVGAIGAASLATAMWIGTPTADPAEPSAARTAMATAIATVPDRAAPPRLVETRDARLAPPLVASSGPAAPPVPSAASVDSDPAAEMALLRDAQAAASTAPSRSLALLDEAESRFPRSGLAQERVVIRVQALIAAGRRDDALARARALLAANPGTAHRPRLEQLLPELVP